MFILWLINTKKNKQFLIPRHLRLAKFYLSPKINKPQNPCGPIVASNGAQTENISKFVNFFMQPCITRLPSFLQDATNFINKLWSLPVLPPQSFLVPLDVSSLYTNSRTTNGLQPARRLLTQGSHQYFLQLVLDILSG